MDQKTRKDMLLITVFRKNARENLTQISKITHIPISTVFDKLHGFEKELIQKHTTLVNFKKLGFDIKINMLFKVERDFKEEFKKFLMGNEHINSVFRVNNGYDYMIEAIFRDMSDLQNFTDQLDKYHIESRQELFILEDLKRESFLSEEIHLRLLQ